MLDELVDTDIHPDWDAVLFKQAQYIVSPPDKGDHIFYFMPDGTVAVVTDQRGRATKRVFAYKNGQWAKENVDG